MRVRVVGAIAVGMCLTLLPVNLAFAQGAEMPDVPGPLGAPSLRSIGDPPFPKPASLPGLPGDRGSSVSIELSSRYSPQTSCDPREKPGVAAFKAAVLAQYRSGKDWGSTRNCTDDGISEHLEGRAWDWNVNVSNPTQFAQAAQLLAWLTDNDGYNGRRLGIMYIGYNSKIWGAYRSAEGWRPLSNSNPHTDHVHFSFTWNGAMGETSFWKGSASPEDYGPCRVYTGQPAPVWQRPNPAPCPVAQPLPPELRGAKLLWRGSKGTLVKQAQKRVKRGSLKEVGSFGPKTARAVMKYQRKKGLPVTGAVDAQTWFALGMTRSTKKSPIP